MSTNYLGEKNNYLAEQGSILSLVKPAPEAKALTPAEAVSKYVRETIAAKGLSYVKVSQAARQKGHDLSSSTVNAVIQNLVKSSRVETLQALAAGLGEPEDNIFAIARGQQPSDDAGFKKGVFAMLHRDFHRLSDAKQREVEPYVEVLKLQIQKRLR